MTTGTACTGTGAVTMAYDALGNITQKSDVCATANCFVYGGTGAGPHALTSIVGTYNGVANPTFTYDANGAMTAGAGRTVAVTAFNMASQITDGANTAAFGYDPEHARYRMLTAGLNAGTTFYLNDPSSGAMEEESIVSGVTTWRDYIMVGGKMVAERFCSGAPPCGAAPTIDYFVLDHLGSIAVIVSATGSVLSRLSYDAWGKRRNPDGSALSCTAGLTSPGSVTRGFTGQEMVDGLCLINFNARVYNPSLGRFMSADPVVGDETILQELNRYSYVLNDPLSLTDPSGMCGFFCSFIKDVFEVVLAFVLVQPEFLPALGADLGFTTTNAALALAVNASIAGGISTFIVTGSLKGAALAALQAGLFSEAGSLLQAAGKSGFLGIGHFPSAFIAHGLVAGLVSEIGTGNFGAGFLAGGVSSLAPAPVGKQSWEDTVEGSIESATLGGLGSVLGGGKFQDGAITGAFAYLFNEFAHKGGTNAQSCNGNLACEKAIYQAAYDQAGRDNWLLAIPALAPAAVAAGVELGGWIGDLLLSGGEAAYGTAAVELSPHAADQAAIRGITEGEIYNAIENGQFFQYTQNEQALTGYYDSSTNVFVGVGDRIKTVFRPSNAINYINNLLKSSK